MEHSRTTEVKVGAMVAVGIFFFILTVIMLGGNQTLFKPTYTLRIIFDQVPGLFKGSVVQVLGVPVGNIEFIGFASNGGKQALEVTVRVDRAHMSKITEGTIADVRTQGALGDKFIYLIPGPPENPAIAANSLIPSKKGGGLFDTMAENTDQIDKIFKIIDETHSLLSSLNQDGKSAQLMSNLVDASFGMKSSFTDLARELRGSDIKKATTALASILDKVDKGNGTLAQLINDPSVYEGIKRYLGAPAGTKYMKTLVRETIQGSEK